MPKAPVKVEVNINVSNISCDRAADLKLSVLENLDLRGLGELCELQVISSDQDDVTDQNYEFEDDTDLSVCHEEPTVHEIDTFLIIGLIILFPPILFFINFRYQKFYDKTWRF